MRRDRPDIVALHEVSTEARIKGSIVSKGDFVILSSEYNFAAAEVRLHCKCDPASAGPFLVASVHPIAHVGAERRSGQYMRFPFANMPRIVHHSEVICLTITKLSPDSFIALWPRVVRHAYAAEHD